MGVNLGGGTFRVNKKHDFFSPRHSKNIIYLAIGYCSQNVGKQVKEAQGALTWLN